MVNGHVEALFSAAYDGELSPDARAAFDRHLGECSGCAAAFAELTTAVDALREQPPARMPHPVRLPEGSPVPERRRFGVPAWLRPPQGRRWVGGLTAAGLVAAAGVAALVVHLNAGVVSTPSSSSAAFGPMAAAAAPGSVKSSAAIAGGSAGGGPCTEGNCPAPAEIAPPSSAACAATALSVSAASAAQIPGGFNNQATKNDGVTHVVLAATGSDYTPGETVDIYARTIDDATSGVSLPCVVLSGPEVGGSSVALGVPSTAIAATPDGTLTAGGPVLKVVVPSTASAGQTYEIVVDVPATTGDPQAWQVSIQIDVT